MHVQASRRWIRLPFNRQCNSCEHFVLTGANYGYWKRQEERWAAIAEGAPDESARDYIYGAFEKSSQALAGSRICTPPTGLVEQELLPPRPSSEVDKAAAGCNPTPGGRIPVST